MEFLDPILKLGPFWTIFVLSLVITLFSNIVYKLVTDQSRMKHLKREQKKHQARMKKHKDNPDKLMQIQKEAMSVNMEYMKHSFKPMIFTMLPLFLLLGWMSSNLNYAPIMPNHEFSTTLHFNQGTTGNATLVSAFPEGIEIIGQKTVPIKDNKATWTLKGNSGKYTLEYEFDKFKFTNDVLIDRYKYIEPVKKIDNKYVTSISTDLQRNKPIKFGDFGMTWIWSYLVISIIMNIIIRKVLDIS